MATILVVDDDDVFRDAICTTLRGAGYLVLEAGNGKEALLTCRSCGSTVIDLMLTDLVMPEMEGVELIMRLRKEFSNIKVIAMSGGGINEAEIYLAITRQMGAKKTLVKPFSRAELLEAIQKVLGIHVRHV